MGHQPAPEWEADMTLRKASLIAGSVGFLVTVFVPPLLSYADRHNIFSFQTMVVLERILQVVCPPSLGLMATEHTGAIGTIIIVGIVAAENFVIYLLAALFLSVLWMKYRTTRSRLTQGSALRDRQDRSPTAQPRADIWRYRTLATTGIILLACAFAGLASCIMSFGWSWRYLPAAIAVFAVSLICLRAASRIKRTSSTN
jgi:hypothetical protein